MRRHLRSLDLRILASTFLIMGALLASNALGQMRQIAIDVERDDGGSSAAVAGDMQKLPIDQNDVAAPLSGLDQANPITGSYAFSIPIKAPPGINGLVPHVSLDYSSDGAEDSIAGVGFSLSAFQCIDRRGPAQNTERQGLVFPSGVPTFTDNDTFYLEGDRLVLCDDQDGGATDACPSGTYRKRDNDFVKIVKIPAQKKFVAYQRDGSVVEYGASALVYRYWEGAPDDFDHTYRFCTSRIVKDGNTIDYTYQTAPPFAELGSKTLVSIDYGGQSAATHKWRFRFSYETRPIEDTRDLFGTGGMIRLASRLKTIEVLTLPGLSRVSKMVITYESSADTKRSRIQQVQEFGIADTDSMPPYVFSYPSAATGWSGPEWQSGQNGLSASNVFTNFDVNVRYPGDDQHGAQWPVGTSVADVDRNGLPDLIRHDGQLSAKVYLNNGATPGTWAEDPTWSSRFSSVPLFFNGTIPVNVDQGVRLVDLNGDGYIDVLQAAHSPVDSNGNVYGVWLWDTTMNSGAGGFNSALGAGFKQALQNNRITFNFLANFPSINRAGITQLNSGTMLVDLNGDGLRDILIAREALGFPSYSPGDPRYNHWTTRHEVWLNNGSTFVAPPANTWVVPQDIFNDGAVMCFGKNGYFEWPRDMGVRLGDFNGDGLPDIVQIHYDYNHLPPPDGPNVLVVRFWVNNGKVWEQDPWWENALRTEASRHSGFWISNVERVTGGPSPNYVTTYLGVEIVDINSDGLDDFVQRVCYDGAPPVVPQDCNSQWRSLITEFDGNASTGKLKWRLASEWLMPYYTIRFRSASADENLVDLEDGFRFTDFNGDGVIDLFANKIYNGAQSALLKPSRVRFDRDKVTSIKSPLGGWTYIQYALADGPGKGTALSSNPALPMPKVVVGTLTQWNGRSGGDPLGEVRRTKAFHYFGGRFDPVEREFAGFRAVTVADTVAGQTSYTTTWYGNRALDRCHRRAESNVVVSELMCAPGSTNCFIGSAAQTFAPNLVQASIQANRILKVAVNSYPSCGASTNVRGPFFAPPSMIVRSEYDPTQPAVVVNSKQSFYYDDFGNLVNTLDYLKSSDLYWFRAHWAYYFQPTAGSVWMPAAVCQRGLTARVGNYSRPVKSEYFYYDNNENSICEITGAGKPTLIEKKSWDLTTGISDFTVLERFSYTPAGNVATHTDGRGKVWRTTWNSTLPEILPATSSDPLNRATTFTYDAYGNLKTAQDPNGIKSETRYDGLQRRTESWREVSGAGIVDRHLWGYSLSGDPTSQTIFSQLDFDPGTVLQEVDYLDGFGKPYLEVHYGNMEYHLNCNLFDGAGRLRIRTLGWLPSNGFTFDIDRPRIEHRFDAVGREIETIVPGGYHTAHAYSNWQNEQGKVLKLETRTLQWAGSFYRRSFSMQDSFDRVVAVAECAQGACPTPAQGATGIQITNYTYDTQDNPTDIVLSDGVSKIKTFYNGFGWLTAVKDPDMTNCVDSNVDDKNSGCPRRYAYDENGNRISETDSKYALNTNAGTAIGILYDDLNRPFQKTVAVGWEYFVTYDYTYDQDRCGTGGAYLGQLTEERYTGHFESNSRVHCYDKFGRLASTATSVTLPSYTSPGPQTVQYAYTTSGALKRMTLPDGEQLTYGFEDFGRVKSVTSSVIGNVISLVTYNVQGQRDRIDYGNGYVADFAYRDGNYNTPSGDQRLDNVNLGFWSGGYLYSVNEIHYDYDPAGNVKMIYDYDFSYPDLPDSEEYTYDQLNRVTSFRVDAAQKQSFFYSPLGNFTQRATAPAAATYLSHGTAYGGAAGPHAMLCEGPNQANPCTSAVRTYAYDPNGNLTTYRDPARAYPTTYSYDMENRLKAVVPPSGSSVLYYYGPKGELIADRNNSLLTVYIDPAYELSNGVPVRNYLLGDKIVARREGTSPAVFLITDHLGSVQMVTDPSAATVLQRYYYPFGATLISSGSYQTRLGFNGYVQDSQGVYAYGDRHYNPEIGHFLQPDGVIPDLFNPQSFNRYSYTLNNPVTLVDTTGHDPEDYDVKNGEAPLDEDLAMNSFERWMKENHMSRLQRMFKKTEAVKGKFDVPVVPGAGTVRIELFIQAAISTLGIAGDNRGFDAEDNPNDSRAFFIIDFEKGTGSFQINPSCIAGGPCVSALPLGEGNNIDTIIVGNNKLVLSGSLVNSIYNFAPPLMEPMGPAINFTIMLDASSHGVGVAGYRNAYPSIEITRGKEFLYKDKEKFAERLFDWTPRVYFHKP